MTSSARSVSHQMYNIRALIAQVSLQHENTAYTSPTQAGSGHDHFPYSHWHDIVERAWWKRWEYQSSETQRSDQRKHRCIPFEDDSSSSPNRQATFRETFQNEFLGRQRTFHIADEWFEKLEAKTLPLFKKNKDTRVTTGSRPKPVRVAVLDTGIDPECSFRTRIRGGRNFCEGEKRGNFWEDESGHGTAVAYQVARICPNAEIYIARIAQRTEEGDTMVPDRHAIVQALKVASEEWKVDIINMSFGWELQDDDDGVEEALNAVGNLGHILVFASSTNGGALTDILFPARHRDVIAVDAVDGLGKPFSNTRSTECGRKQERFSAPGLNVAAPYNTRVTGSSFASPIVASVAGLVLETFRKEIPDLNASIYKRLGTKGVMESVLKLLSKEVEGFNFLQPWIELQTGHSRRYFCERIINSVIRPTYKRIGMSYMGMVDTHGWSPTIEAD